MASLVVKKWVGLVFLIFALSLTSAQNKAFDFEFDNDLEGMTSHRGVWKWADRDSLPWAVPAGRDGFAVYDVAGQGDELFSNDVSLEFGLTYSIRIFISSKYERGTTFALHKQSPTGEYLSVIVDFTSVSSPNNDEWIILQGTVAPEDNAGISMFCQSNDENPDPEGFVWGCVVDEVVFISGSDAGTSAPTTLPTTPSTTTSSSTTSFKTTTDESATNTPSTTSRTTTDVPTTTIDVTSPPPTTTEPTTTTVAQTTTPRSTSTYPISTTEAPIPEVIFDFDDSTSGWALGRSNGASWRRTSAANAAVPPEGSSRILFLFANDVVSSTVMATSPRMIAGPTGEISIAINFFIQGSKEYPAFLKIRRAYSYTTYDEEPALSLDGFGEQENQSWLNYGAAFSGITPGEEFFLVLEGSLGIDNLVNQVAVSRIAIQGAYPSPAPEREFFDFDDGLPGWTMGNVDGGRWLVKDYSDIDSSYNVPVPSSGNSVLWVERFDIHSGVVSIDSPVYSVDANTTKHLNIRFWVRGSHDFPASLRIRRKTIDGVYDYLPFLDLSSYGNVINQEWIVLNNFYQIPTDGIVGSFQLVIEADLGGSSANAVAIDSISISTFKVTS